MEFAGFCGIQALQICSPARRNYKLIEENMKMRFSFVLAVGLGLIPAAVPLLAHHSFAAQYDRSKQAKLTGSVTRVDWINPHARFFMDVKDAAGKAVNWEIELSAPAMLM